MSYNDNGSYGNDTTSNMWTDYDYDVNTGGGTGYFDDGDYNEVGSKPSGKKYQRQFVSIYRPGEPDHEKPSVRIFYYDKKKIYAERDIRLLEESIAKYKEIIAKGEDDPEYESALKNLKEAEEKCASIRMEIRRYNLMIFKAKNEMTDAKISNVLLIIFFLLCLGVAEFLGKLL